MDPKSTRQRITKTLIEKIKVDFENVFKKYRKIVKNTNKESSRNIFFNVLKSQIIKSLDGNEKFVLIEEIQRGSPHSEYSSGNLNNSTQFFQPIYYDRSPHSENSSGNLNNSTQFFQSIYYDNMNNNDIQINNNYRQVDLDENQILESTNYQYNDYLVPRSSNNNGSPRSDTKSNIKGKICECSESNSDGSSFEWSDDDIIENETENNEQNLNLIKTLYDEISNLVGKNEDVVEMFKNLKTTHGNEIFEKTIKYIPMDSQNERHPIIYQLTCKIKQYETALDKLIEDDLFNLYQKNIFQTSLLNFLLFRGFSFFYDFLSYLNRRNIQPDIRYILLNNDSLINILTDKSTSYNQKENITNMKVLIDKGILHYRNLFNTLSGEKSSVSKNRQNFIEELITNKLLALVLNEPINKSGSYINDLVNNYPKSDSIIRSLFEKDKSVLLESSFFVLLTKKNIGLIYKHLSDLVNVLKIDKKLLRQACCRVNEDGQSVLSILRTNTDRNCKKQKDFILEFIEAFKN